MPVAAGRRAEPVRVHVHRLQARGERPGHVVAQAVPHVQDAAVRGHVQGVQRDAEDPRVRLGHADHRGVQDDAHLYALWRWSVAVRHVADADAAQVALHSAVGVGDHAHRQPEPGQGAQAVLDPASGVRPAVPPGMPGDLDGELPAPGLGHTAGGDVGRQVVAPPGGWRWRCGLPVLGGHRVIVGPFQDGQVGIQADRVQPGPHVIGPGKDHDAAGVEQDRADSRSHTSTLCRRGPSPPGAGELPEPDISVPVAESGTRLLPPD